MSIIDTLIYDRTQEDVDRVFTLKHKILSEGLESLTPEEKEEYMNGMKGAYNHTDMNRVGQAVEYIANRMTTLPTELDAYRIEKGVADDPIYQVPYDPSSVHVSPKTNWDIGNVPSQPLAEMYIEDLETLRKQLPLPEDAPNLPTSLDGLTFQTANDIEYLLYLIDKTLTEIKNDIWSKIDRTAIAFRYSNLYYSGE